MNVVVQIPDQYLIDVSVKRKRSDYERRITDHGVSFMRKRQN